MARRIPEPSSRLIDAFGVHSRSVLEQLIFTCETLHSLGHFYIENEEPSSVIDNVDNAYYALRFVIEEMTDEEV